jgi:hypothetical protein
MKYKMQIACKICHPATGEYIEKGGWVDYTTEYKTKKEAEEERRVFIRNTGRTPDEVQIVCVIESKIKNNKIDQDWYFYMNLNGVKGMWPAAYYMCDLHFWPCGKIHEERCKCELCTKVAKDVKLIKKYC